MRRLKTVLVTALLCLSLPGRAVPEQPVPYRHINDLSGCTLPAASADSLEAVLCAFDDTTGNQIYAVVTLDLEDMSIEEYANRLFNSWGIGTRENNNGVLILIKAKKDSGDRGGVRIEVGDGLAGVINDARAGRIIDRYMMDYLAAGDMFGAIRSACSVIMPLAAGEFGSDGSDFDKKDDDLTGGFAAGFVVFIMVLLLFIFLSRWRKRRFGWTDNISSRRRRLLGRRRIQRRLRRRRRRLLERWRCQPGILVLPAQREASAGR